MPNVAEGALRRIAPPTESNESSSKRAHENVVQDLPKQAKGEPSMMVSWPPERMDNHGQRTESGEGRPRGEENEEPYLQRPQQKVPSNLE